MQKNNQSNLIIYTQITWKYRVFEPRRLSEILYPLECFSKNVTKYYRFRRGQKSAFSSSLGIRYYLKTNHGLVRI